MSIRWGVSPIAWANDDMPELGGDTPLDSILDDIKAIGFEGVELGGKFPRDAAVLQPIMQRHGLDIIGGWYSSNLLVRTAEEEIAALADHLTLLKAMGSDVFVIAETSNAVHGERASRLDSPPRLAPGDWAEFGRRMNQVSAYLADQGVRLAYHHHLGTVVETEQDLDMFLSATDARVGLVLDTGHALYGEIDPLELVRRHPERIVHVHCKDVRRPIHRRMRDEGRSFLDGVVAGMFTAPGDGEYDYTPFLRGLAEMHYRGWIVIEAEQDPALADPRTYSQLGLETLQRLARQEGLTT
jgi:inosose dehydratase